MNHTQPYLVPDYYPAFACKMGRCRHACCEGWPVTFSLQEYYRLLSEDCPPELRRKLDGALHLCEYPTREEYAELSHNYLGECPMRMEDGRCLIQGTLGEAYLGDVCRLYPRGRRSGARRECSCANSCEAVIEGFLGREEPLTFRTEALTFSDGESLIRPGADDCPEERSAYLAVLQDRSRPLFGRIIRLGQIMGVFPPDGELPPPIPSGDMVALLQRVFHSVVSPRDGIAPLGEQIFAAATDPAFPADGCDRGWAMAQELLGPHAFEHILVNHLFFSQFPTERAGVGKDGAFRALCLGFLFLAFFSSVTVFGGADRDGTVDMIARYFRCVEHTDFDSCAALMVKKCRISDAMLLSMIEREQ